MDSEERRDGLIIIMWMAKIKSLTLGVTCVQISKLHHSKRMSLVNMWQIVICCVMRYMESHNR